MPTFYDPVSDADEASQALRGLAHASRSFEHPRDLYGVLGDVLSGVRSLRQVLDQLSTAHTERRPFAFDDVGNPETGDMYALAAGDGLHEAATMIYQAEGRLDEAMTAAGRIAWHTNPDPATEQREAAGAARRWVSIVFLQGEDADEVLDIIDRDGPEAAMNHLASWDYGTETTDAALSDGHVYEKIPTSGLDQMAAEGDYRMTYNPAAGHVALYRQHTVVPEDRVDLPDTAPTRTPRPAAGRGGPARNRETARQGAAAGSAARSGSWFEHPGVAQVKRDRGLGL
ncbi:hypothetical protein [Brachybacterium tyrofermentans]|uniref:hypothetical protein n=1 Tax=Brachybacterium tyrofermentans TaxID=47848 RepID=UPI003FD0D610